MGKEMYICPGQGCNANYASLADIFQHIDRKHKLRGRFFVVDRENTKIYLTDRAGVRVGELEGLEPVEKPVEVTAAA